MGGGNSVPTEIKGLNEECGVFGVFDAANASQLTYYGLHTLQHRGQEGAGIVSTDGTELYTPTSGVRRPSASVGRKTS